MPNSSKAFISHRSPLEIGVSLLALSLTALALTACSGSKDGALVHPGPTGRDAGNGGKQKTPAPTPLLATSDTWIPTARTCNGAKLDLDPSESVHLDFTVLARVAEDVDARTNTQYCETTYLYKRTPSAATTVNGTYTETAAVVSDKSVETCYRKANGHVNRTQPTKTTDGAFGPEAFTSSIVATATSVTLTLNKPVDCPSGDLVLTLVKSK